MTVSTPLLFVMIDGLRPDALAQASCSHLTELQHRAAWSLSARSVMPSVTLPCHMSIFHSVPPTRHGVVTNDWQPMVRPVNGLVDVARAHNKRCAFFHNWEPLRNLNRPESLAYSFYIDNCYANQPQADHVVVRHALAAQAEHGFDFLFVYLGMVDVAGHAYGWMSPGYLEQVNRADDALGQLLAGLPADTTILLQADHGGHDRTHGTESPQDMTIPWLVAGPGVKAGEIQSPVSLLDTAPTLAHFLDIPADPIWEGRFVDEILAT